MTHKITTGPHPGYHGACIAHYNHVTYSHHLPHQTAHNPGFHQQAMLPSFSQPYGIHSFFDLNGIWY